MPRSNDWTRDQLLIALRLYIRLPFGWLHGKNPEIVRVTRAIGACTEIQPRLPTVWARI